MIQDEVDKNVVIKNVQQDILPSIPVQSSTDVAIKEVDLLKKLNPSSTAAEDDDSVDSGQGGSVESDKPMNKECDNNLYAKSCTPDIVPKSFQDKRYKRSYSPQLALCELFFFLENSLRISVRLKSRTK